MERGMERCAKEKRETEREKEREREREAGNRRVHEKYRRGAEFRRCYQPLTFTLVLFLALLLSFSHSLLSFHSADEQN